MNYIVQLTTEEAPVPSQFDMPSDFSLSGFSTWCANPLPSFLSTSSSDIPEHCMEALHQELMRLHYNEAIYDYIVAVQGDIHASLPGKLPKLGEDRFTLKTSGVAYYSTGTTALDVGGLTECLLHEIKDHLYLLEEYEQAYDYVVATRGQLDISEHLASFWFARNDVLVIAGANAISAIYGPVHALPYTSEQCAMPLSCLAALEDYYNDSASAQSRYERDVEAHFALQSQQNFGLPVAQSALVGMLTGPLIVSAWTTDDKLHVSPASLFGSGPVSQSEFPPSMHNVELEMQVESSEVVLSLPQEHVAEFLTVFGAIDALFEQSGALQHVDPRDFVAKLELVDISEIQSEDMVCFHCWSDFGDADGGKIELKIGLVEADHTPVKLPCPSGHLICKTCLMQLIDANVHLCPKCRVDIVVLVD